MFKARVLSFSIFSDRNQIHILVWRVYANKTFARTNIREQIQFLSHCHIQWSVTLSDGSRKWTFRINYSLLNAYIRYNITLETPFILDDCIEGFFFDKITSIVDGLSVNFMVFPINWCFYGRKDIANSLRYLRANSVSREENNSMILFACLSNLNVKEYIIEYICEKEISIEFIIIIINLNLKRMMFKCIFIHIRQYLFNKWYYSLIIIIHILNQIDLICSKDDTRVVPNKEINRTFWEKQNFGTKTPVDLTLKIAFIMYSLTVYLLYYFYFISNYVFQLNYITLWKKISIYLYHR